jgi:hypothetical protein
LKNVLIFEKKGRYRFVSRVCMVGCMGRISHTNLKNCRIYPRVFSRIAISKNQIGLLVPVRSETGFVIQGKFWSRYDRQTFRKRNFLGDDQGELRLKQRHSTRELSLVFKYTAVVHHDTLASTCCSFF